MIPHQLMVSVIVAGLLAAGAYFYGRSDGRGLERAEWTARDNVALREANDALNAAHEKARKQEQAHAEAQAQLTVDYEKELDRAENDRDRALARVRSGELRLRNTAAGCAPDGNRAAEAAASAAGSAAPAAGGELPDTGDGPPLREEEVVALLSEADEVVDEVNYCWAIVRADRGLK